MSLLATRPESGSRQTTQKRVGNSTRLQLLLSFLLIILNGFVLLATLERYLQQNTVLADEIPILLLCEKVAKKSAPQADGTHHPSKPSVSFLETRASRAASPVASNASSVPLWNTNDLPIIPFNLPRVTAAQQALDHFFQNYTTGPG